MFLGLQTKEPQCDPDTLRALVRSHVANSDLLSSVGTELSFRLPINANAKFPALMRDLDSKRASLGISNWGLSVTTMEEVFLRVAGHQSHKEAAAASTPLGSAEEHKAEVSVPITAEASLKKTEKLDASSLAAFAEQQTFKRHFIALMAKRWHFSKRDERAICCSYVIPLIILVLGLGLLQLPATFQYPQIIMGQV